MNADKMNAFHKQKLAEHVAAVNKFAAKIGTRYPAHDADKFADPLLSQIAPMMWCRYNNIKTPNPVFQRAAMAMANHKRATAHHPEHWKNIADMPDDAIAEMCCDWCARGRYTSPWRFYSEYAQSKYKFTARQQELINDLLTKLWGNCE